MKTPSKTRKVLVILSNRWNRGEKPRFFELDTNEKGDILKEKRLTREPTKPVYDEVWEHDEGKRDVASANRFKRKYPHKLEKPKAK